jgi:uracil-DNA glycosylase
MDAMLTSPPCPDSKTPPTVRPARGWPDIWPAFVNATRDWHALPVPAFGDLDAELLVVGLGPGEKGANRTGRPFTGDVAGELLYPALHRFGFASSPEPLGPDHWANPAMQLSNCRITNAVRCLPPANKPTTPEIRQCFDAKELLATLTDLPGVYRMLDADGKGALRRQGKEPQEARRVVLPRESPEPAHCLMVARSPRSKRR